MEHALEEIEIVAAVGGQVLHLNADFGGELLQARPSEAPGGAPSLARWQQA
jgi:hypothetical protein